MEGVGEESTPPWFEAYKAMVEARVSQLEGEVQTLSQEASRLQSDVSQLRMENDKLREQKARPAAPPGKTPAVPPLATRSTGRSVTSPAERVKKERSSGPATVRSPGGLHVTSPGDKPSTSPPASARRSRNSSVAEKPGRATPVAKPERATQAAKPERATPAAKPAAKPGRATLAAKPERATLAAKPERRAAPSPFALIDAHDQSHCIGLTTTHDKSAHKRLVKLSAVSKGWHEMTTELLQGSLVACEAALGSEEATQIRQKREKYSTLELVNGFDRNALAEVFSLRRPPALVVPVIQAAFALVWPEMAALKKGQTGIDLAHLLEGEDAYELWDKIVKNKAEEKGFPQQFLERLQNIPSHRIPPPQDPKWELLKSIANNDRFSIDNMRRLSTACALLVQVVQAVVALHDEEDFSNEALEKFIASERQVGPLKAVVAIKTSPSTMSSLRHLRLYKNVVPWGEVCSNATVEDLPGLRLVVQNKKLGSREKDQINKTIAHLLPEEAASGFAQLQPLSFRIPGARTAGQAEA